MNLKLLMIEDNEDDAMLILRELRRGGYTPEWLRVETVEETQQALQDRQWDLVISDFSLPSFSGPAALAVLKASGNDTPFIIVSGTVGEETAVASLKAGAHDFLAKNNLNRLLPAIDRELRDAAGRRDRLLAQRRLRESENALAAVFDSSPLPILTIDARGTITAFNKAAETTFGMTAMQVLGDRATFVHPVPEENTQWSDRVLAGEPIQQLEVRGDRHNGDQMDMLLSASPLQDSEGAITGAVVIINDVTSQRALEEQLRQAQKMEAIGRLAGGVAHDFNNILTAITGYGTLLQDSMPPNSESRSDIEGILDAASRAATFTRQLLAFSRKQVTQREILNVNDLVGGMINMLQRVIGDDYSMELNLSEELDPVLADRGQMGQVLMNLVVNARDAMPSGGKIGITTMRARAIPERRMPPNGDAIQESYVVISVTDTGHGIPVADIERIFEPFYTTKDTSKGTGLGLSTVYGIITGHGGFMTVDSVLKQGTTFTIYLPERRGATLQQQAATVRPAQPRTRAIRVLVVEDDGVILSLIRRTLSRGGFDVQSTGNGATALEVLREGGVDVLITDLMLPGITGAELIAHLREIDSSVKAILISGYSARDLDLPPDIYFLEKPFSPDDLVAAVRAAAAG